IGNINVEGSCSGVRGTGAQAPVLNAGSAAVRPRNERDRRSHADRAPMTSGSPFECAQADLAPQEDRPPIMHRKVLLIDDVPETATHCQQMLTGTGDVTYSVIHAGSAGEALGMIEGERPDCILIRWSPSGQGGAAALHRILSRRPNMPLVML